jgi:hypothetical protein
MVEVNHLLITKNLIKMKKFTTLLVLLSLTINIIAQPPNKIIDTDVKACFSIYLDGKKVETDDVLVGFKSFDSLHMYAKINDEFTTYLKANKTYEMIITHTDYERQIIRITTANKADSLFIKLDLNKGKDMSFAGSYKYNEVLNKYIRYD